MAGLWNLSFQQLHDLNGNPYPGAKAYFYAADSLTPLTVYQDYGLGTAHPNPVEADANGVFPPVFLDEADNFFRQRITSRGGIIIGRTDLTVLPIIGPSGGGGGSEVPVDANSLFQTGDLLWLDSSGTRAGWVRDNGRTIGSSTSGASERANSDCEQLYLFGWAKGWSVVGGTGDSASADWSANKPITLPDKRFKLPAGLADMGNSAVSVSTAVPFTTGDSTTAGSIGGESVGTITQAQLPAVAPTFTGSSGSVSVTSTVADILRNPGGYQGDPAGGSGGLGSGVQTGYQIVSTGSFTPSGAISALGSGASINNMPPFVLGTFYRRL